MGDGLAGRRLAGAVESRDAERAVGEHDGLHRHPGLERILEADAPGAGREHFAADFDQEFSEAFAAQDLRGAVRRVALQQRAEVEAQLLMLLREREVGLI